MLSEAGTVKYQVTSRACIEIPSHLFDEDGEPLSWITDLSDTGIRLMVEGAAVVHRTETMSGSWEVRLNMLPMRAGTKVRTQAPLDFVVAAE